MNALLSEEVLVALALPLGLMVMQVSHSSYKWIRNYAITRCIECVSQMIMAEVEPSDKEMRALRLRFSVGVLLDATLFIAERVYGDTLNRLALIVEVCDLDYCLVGRIHRAKGLSRAWYLSKLSILTRVSTIAEYAEDYIADEHRDTCFYAMAALVSSRPERAILYIARFESRLSLFEVAVLVQFMYRAGAPIAYTPLLLSQNRNLQLVGIYLSEYFSIVDAETHLQRLAESDDDEVSYMALQTLCSIRGDISTPQAVKALRRLLPHQRISFILHAVRNCYTMRSCMSALGHEERQMFSQRINTYKCQIVCN